MALALLEVRNLTKIFDIAESPLGVRRPGEVRAVDDVSLEIHAGETLGLVGESGSGKSPLGRLILRLIEPTSGSVVFDGVDLRQANGSKLRCLRRNMQIIFQDPFGSPPPPPLVGEGHPGAPDFPPEERQSEDRQQRSGPRCPPPAGARTSPGGRNG